jgi:hypothetical protein
LHGSGLGAQVLDYQLKTFISRSDHCQPAPL